MGGRGGSVNIVLTKDLFKPFNNKACLVSDGLAIFIAFEEKNPLATKNFVTCRNVRARDEFIDTHLLEALELILDTKDPLGRVRRRHGLGKGGFVRVAGLMRGDASSTA